MIDYSYIVENKEDLQDAFFSIQEGIGLILESDDLLKSKNKYLAKARQYVEDYHIDCADQDMKEDFEGLKTFCKRALNLHFSYIHLFSEYSLFNFEKKE
jgi:hypothetical protein